MPDRKDVSTMIDDVSKTLKRILDDKAIANACKELFDAEIVFDRPTEQFKPDKLTVDLFLYEVRENMEMRSNEPLISRSDGKAIIKRAPLRVACSYLVTAWAPGTGEESQLKEQRLLSQTLQVLSRYPTIPEEFFPSESPLKTQEPPLPMMITQMGGVKDPADFWSAIGGKMRPSLAVTVTVSLPVFEPDEPEGEPLVKARRIEIGERTSHDQKRIPPEKLSSAENIFGTITGPDDKPVEGAIVTILELGLKATTDAEGSYSLGLIPKGSYRLRVEPQGEGSRLKPKDVNVDVPASAETKVQLDS